MKTLLQKILRSALLLIVIAFISNAHAWKLVKEGEGVQVFTQPSRFESFKMFKGTTTLSTTLQQAVSFLTQADKATQWLHDCIESKVLEKYNPNHYLVYQVTKAPWPVSNRDYVLDIKIEYSDDNLSADIFVEAQSGFVDPHKKRIRVTELHGHWRLEQLNEASLKLTLQTEANPTGTIPAWLANAFVVDQPYNTLRNLQRHFKQGSAN